MMNQTVVYALLLLVTQTFAYPIFGTKRYTRSYRPTWQQVPQRQISQGYNMGPYTDSYVDMGSTYDQFYQPTIQEYPDEYYPQEPAISYYPLGSNTGSSFGTVNRNIGNFRYQPYDTVVPYYERQQPAYAYGYEEPDPVGELEEEIAEEDDRVMPVARDNWYDGSVATPQREEYIDLSDPVVQDFVLGAMYGRGVPGRTYSFNNDDKGIVGRQEQDWGSDSYDNDDEEVEELKSLARLVEKKDSEFSEHGPWVSGHRVYLSGRKAGLPIKMNTRGVHLYPVVPTTRTYHQPKTTPATLPTMAPATTVPPTASSISRGSGTQGQKEVALLRPATPVKHPFSRPVMEEIERSQQPMSRQPIIGKIVQRSDSQMTSHKPSVYQTIKKLMSMEEGLRKEADKRSQLDSASRPPQKRFVSSEESLVEELSGLKKMSA